jgi:hypothetical protein
MRNFSSSVQYNSKKSKQHLEEEKLNSKSVNQDGAENRQLIKPTPLVFTGLTDGIKEGISPLVV